mmetsp:Transcript_23732/g.80857  ORF Transcript_23732/g.80857 Transcript_23732/m.80857 type:complete len:129 (+) Transcript_23732:232-618(+)
MASPDVIWQVIKRGNAFMRQSVNHTRFSKEDGNLTNKHNFASSGLANERAIGLIDGEGVGAVKMTIKRPAKAANPVKAVHTASMKKNNKRLMKAVKGVAGKYRPDMVTTACRRVSALHKATRAAKAAK